MGKLDLICLVAAGTLLLFVAVRQFAGHPVVSGAPTDIGVNDLIKNLADELKKNEADLRDRKEPGLFSVKSAEIEVAFVLKESRSASGELTLAPVVAKAGDESSNEVHHTLKISLIPLE